MSRCLSDDLTAKRGNLMARKRFLAKQEAEANKIQKLPSRRASDAIAAWAPAEAPPPIVALTGTATFTFGFKGSLTVSDPDPPLIA